MHLCFFFFFFFPTVPARLKHRYQAHVVDALTRVFRAHGALRIHTPALMPKSAKLSERATTATFMDPSGSR
jgi:hypothetical protein